MNKLRILIIDDEFLARDLVKSLLSEDDAIEVVGEAENGFEGFKLINELHPDLIFLDVMMPKLTGFEMLELLDNPPVVIFSTAYDEYAIKAFEKNAIDYLLKPYTTERFNEALTKARERMTKQNEVVSQPSLAVAHQQVKNEPVDRIVVKTGNKIHIISLDKLRYIESMDDYVKLHTEAGVFLKQQTMKTLEESLPGQDFIRIHRSFIVRVKEIARLEPMRKETYVAILKSGKELSVSRSGYARLKAQLNF